LDSGDRDKLQQRGREIRIARADERSVDALNNGGFSESSTTVVVILQLAHPLGEQCHEIAPNGIRELPTFQRSRHVSLYVLRKGESLRPKAFQERKRCSHPPDIDHLGHTEWVEKGTWQRELCEGPISLTSREQRQRSESRL
jgi:hypothetical protein